MYGHVEKQDVYLKNKLWKQIFYVLFYLKNGYRQNGMIVFCEWDATVVSTPSSSVKKVQMFLFLIWNSAILIRSCKLSWTLTFTLQHRSVALWRGCCLWGLRPAAHLYLRSADSTAGALQPPGTPGYINTDIFIYMVPLSDQLTNIKAL